MIKTFLFSSKAPPAGRGKARNQGSASRASGSLFSSKAPPAGRGEVRNQGSANYMSRFLILGLGNPDKKYLENRHNVGCNFIVFLAKKWQTNLFSSTFASPFGSELRAEPLSVNSTRNQGSASRASRFLSDKQNPDWKKSQKCFAEFVSLNKENQKFILAKPLVFMNDSGKSVNQLKKFYNLSIENIFIAHDDTDINLGNFKISYNRGSAGHKGVESIIDHLKSKAFYRIRIGIRPFSLERKKAEKLVLKNFTPRENGILEKTFSAIEEELEKTYFKHLRFAQCKLHEKQGSAER